MHDIWLILVILSILGMFMVALAFLFRHSLFSVIKVFRKNRAVEEKKAKTAEELGITVKNDPNELNFVPHALKMLQSNNIIRLRDNDKLYLSEKELASYYKNSRLMRFFLPLPYYEKKG